VHKAFLLIRHVSELRRFNFGVAFIIVIVDFYKIETIRSNVLCQMSFLFAVEERNSALRNIFVISQYSFLSTFLIVWWGLIRLNPPPPSNWPSLLTVLVPRTLSTQSPSNDHNNTERHERKSVLTLKRWRNSCIF
jgi:hypothetical protein